MRLKSFCGRLPSRPRLCPFRPTRREGGVRSWSTFSVAIAVLLVLGCSTDEGGPTATAGAPEVAATPSQCNAATTGSSFIPNQITAQFTAGNRTSVKTKCVNILQKVAQGDDATATAMAVDLASFILRHSTAGNTEAGQLQKLALINAFFCLIDCALQIPEESLDGGFLGVVGTAGGTFFTENGKAGYRFPPGWSSTPRIVFSEPLADSFLLDTELPQFPAYFRHGTIPADPFLQTVFLAQCAEAPGFPNSSLRLAKNQDDFDDPNGTEVDGIEFFPPGTNPPGFLLPDCPVPEEDEPVPSLHHAGSALAAAGAVADKRGGSGVTLAGRTGVGSQVSAFSEWGSVSIQDEAPTATISGTTFVVEEGDVSVQGVTVDLFCNESSEPIASTTSNADGNFFFDGEVDGFEPGDDCYLEASKEVDGGALSGRNPSVSSEVFSFEVQEGENDRDIQLEPNADAEIIGNATWDNDGTQEPFPFADVALFCEGLEGLEERAAVVADEGGFYELNTIEHDFDIGDECFVEATGVPFEGVGSYSGSNPEEGTFTVEAGTAIRDIQTFNVGS